jgi:hypothetical protein
MKNIFDAPVRAEVIDRIKKLNNNCAAQWGRMNVQQMIMHCILWNEMVLENKKLKRVFIGRIFGKLLLRNELKDRPMRKNNPTVPELIPQKWSSDIELTQKEWTEHINRFENYSLPDYQFVHPFFGRMTKEQIGIHAYKHTDHHLRQFGV